MTYQKARKLKPGDTIQLKAFVTKPLKVTKVDDFPDHYSPSGEKYPYAIVYCEHPEIKGLMLTHMEIE